MDVRPATARKRAVGIAIGQATRKRIARHRKTPAALPAFFVAVAMRG
jgi:hypothetical protein